MKKLILLIQQKVEKFLSVSCVNDANKFHNSIVTYLKELCKVDNPKEQMVKDMKFNETDMENIQIALNSTDMNAPSHNKVHETDPTKAYDNFAYYILNSYAIVIKTPNIEMKDRHSTYYDMVITLLKKTIGILMKEKLDSTGMPTSHLVVIRKDDDENARQMWIGPIYPTCEYFLCKAYFSFIV